MVGASVAVCEGSGVASWELTAGAGGVLSGRAGGLCDEDSVAGVGDVIARVVWEVGSEPVLCDRKPSMLAAH